MLKTLSPLFSIAPMLKSSTATMWYTSRSYSRPYVCSSHFIESLSDCIGREASQNSCARIAPELRQNCAARHLHRPVELVDVVRLRPHRQPHAAPRARGERRLDALQLPRHQREEVRRLAERVDKLGVVAAGANVALAHLVAVAEEQRVRRLVGLDAHLVGGHHVGAVLEVRDPPEALGLALRHVVAARLVQPRQLRVLLGLDRHRRRQRELVARRRRQQRQPLLRAERVAFAGRQRRPINVDRPQVEVLAVELHRHADRRPRRALDGERRGHQRLLLVDVKVQRQRINAVRRRGVVLAELLDRRLGRSDSRRHQRRAATAAEREGARRSDAGDERGSGRGAREDPGERTSCTHPTAR